MVRTETFEDRVLLTVQTISTSAVVVPIADGGTGSFDVIYSSDMDSTGLVLRMHFDSSEVTFDEPDFSSTPQFFNLSFLNAFDVQEDTADDDMNPDTDMILNILYVSQAGVFPSGPSGSDFSQPITLFTATFTPTGAFDGTPVNFTGQGASGFTLELPGEGGRDSVVLTEPPPTPELSISDATVTEGGDLTFNVTVTGDSADGPVSVDVASATGSASAADFTAVTQTLNFAAGGARTQTVTVSTVNDLIPENAESLTLTLSNAVNANIADATATGTINDTPDTPIVSISGGGTVEEGASLTYTVALNFAPLSNLTVDVATNDGTAVAGDDFSAVASTLTFTPGGALTQSITVSTVNDDDSEDDESFTVGLASIVGGTIGTATASGTITDDDGNGTIGGTKFHDRNLNGTRDAGEEGLSGVVITLTNTDDNTTFGTATTGTDGTYQFTEVPPANYSVTETLQDGFVQSFPVSALDQAAFDLDQSENLFFSGNDFEDWGGFGERWMQGDAGWYFITPDGAFFEWDGSPRTQLTGDFIEQFDSSFHDDISLLFDASAPNGHQFELASNQQLAGIDFGNFQLGTISGLKFGDVDGNGIQDDGDVGLEGWTIQLLDTNGAIVASTVTDANGTYQFDDVTPGDYLIREVQQDGFVQTFPEIDPDVVLAEQAFRLDQAEGFFETQNDFFDWGGREEKWFQGTDGYHFVTPNGNIFEWDGSSRDALTGILVGDLDSTYYDDPSLIVDAQFPGGAASTLESGGSVVQNFGNTEAGLQLGDIVGGGNVEVSVSDGDLVIRGDDAANAVIVYLNEDGNIVVVGGGATTLNGSSDEYVAFESADTIPDDLRIDMNGGANLLVIQDINVNDDVRISSDGENDFLLLQNVNVADDLNISTDSGDDIVGLNEVFVGDRTDIATDGGNDVVGVISSHHAGNVRLKARSGDDLVVSDGTRFGNGVALDMSSGDDKVAALGSFVAGVAELDGGSDTDSVLAQNTTSPNDLIVEAFEADSIGNLNELIDAALARLAERGVEFSFDAGGNIVTE